MPNSVCKDRMLRAPPERGSRALAYAAAMAQLRGP
jgi:hypothetical protein